MNKMTLMEKVVAKSFGNTVGIMVLKKGEKVYENYFNGYHAENRIQIASATKSIFSILVGIAADKGLLDIEQKVLEFFPNYAVPRGEQTLPEIRIKDLLSMTVPYKCKEEPYQKVFTKGHWVDSALEIMGGKEKIGTFRYAPMVGIQVLSSILTQVTGKTALEFAKENLFEPLEIAVYDSEPIGTKEDNMEFLKSKDRHVWIEDQEGFTMAAWGLTLSVSDMAKIGQLYLDGGKWKGQQIVSTKWVNESISVHSICKEWKASYGYLWWILDEKNPSFAAMGDGGNTIYVNTKEGLVIAIACAYQPGAKDRRELIKKYIEPVFAE